MIHNERVKLLANALDRASTTFGAGSIVPLLGWIRALPPSAQPGDAATALFGMVAFVICAVVLHLLARRELGNLL